MKTDSVDRLAAARDWLRIESAWLPESEQEGVVRQLDQQMKADPLSDPFAVVNNILCGKVYAHLAD